MVTPAVREFKDNYSRLVTEECRLAMSAFWCAFLTRDSYEIKLVFDRNIATYV